MTTVYARQAWELLAELRDSNWTVASHNDYRQNGVPMSFWLLTRDTGDGPLLAVKGEGHTDLEALEQCAAQARALFKPSP